MRFREGMGLIAWIAISFVPAAVGGAVTDPAWYESLQQPPWAPPTWLFSPVWTVLYLLMGIAAWLVWRRGGFAPARLALGLFLVQLVLNGAWSSLFFGLRRPDVAFAEIVLLWAAILATAIAFGRHSRPASWLLAPYLFWVTYAAGLNLALWWLNR